MDKIILDLLKDNGRVIIPDFGALIVKQKSPFTVIFNEFLQYNDGALIGAISSKEGVDRDEAADKTRKFIKDIQGKLEKGEEIPLTGIGILTKSSTGKISIKEAGEAPKAEKKAAATKKETPKTVEFDLEEQKKPAPAPEKKEAPKTTTKKTLPGGIPDNKQKKEMPKPGQKKPLPGAAPKKEIPRPAAKKETPRPTATRPTARPVSETKTSTDTPPITEYYSEGKGKNKWNIILWIIVILIVNGAIVGFFLFNDEIREFFNKKPDNVETQLPETTPAEEETAVLSDTATETQPEIEPVIEGTPEEEYVEEEVQETQEIFAGTKYYVVAGVFSVESNADNLVKELRANGYNAEKFGKIGNMHAVSYDVFPTKREADRLMLKIQREVNSGAWIKIVD